MFRLSVWELTVFSCLWELKISLSCCMCTQAGQVTYLNDSVGINNWEGFCWYWEGLSPLRMRYASAATDTCTYKQMNECSIGKLFCSRITSLHWNLTLNVVLLHHSACVCFCVCMGLPCEPLLPFVTQACWPLLDIIFYLSRTSKHSLTVACCTVTVAEKERENKSQNTTREMVSVRGMETIKKHKSLF